MEQEGEGDADAFRPAAGLCVGRSPFQPFAGLLQVVRTFQPDNGVVYVRSLTVDFPVKSSGWYTVSAWTCVPEVYINCNNLISSCQLATSIAMVSLPGDVDPTPNLAERSNVDFSLPVGTAILERSAAEAEERAPHADAPLGGRAEAGQKRVPEDGLARPQLE